MPRARGGSPFTTFPPIRTSPSVGSSSPAMTRSKVVFPHPDGPSRTRYSPAWVAISTPSTALTSPVSKCFFSPRTSTTCAMLGPLSSRGGSVRGAPVCVAVLTSTTSASSDEALPPPLGEDLLTLLVRLLDRLLGFLSAACDAGEHVGQDERAVDLADGRVRRSGVAQVRRPVQRRLEGLELGRVVALDRERVLVEPPIQLGHLVRIARQVVQLRFVRNPRQVGRVVKQELLRGVEVGRERRRDPVVHHVLCRDRGLRSLERRYEVDVLRYVRDALLRGPPSRDRVEDVAQLAGDKSLVVRRRIPGEDFVGHRPVEQLLGE